MANHSSVIFGGCNKKENHNETGGKEGAILLKDGHPSNTAFTSVASGVRRKRTEHKSVTRWCAGGSALSSFFFFHIYIYNLVKCQIKKRYSSNHSFSVQNHIGKMTETILSFSWMCVDGFFLCRCGIDLVRLVLMVLFNGHSFIRPFLCCFNTCHLAHLFSLFSRLLFSSSFLSV
jgi:hypothetical protein